MIDRYYGGGIEKATSLLINGFLEEGYDVVLITQTYKPDREYHLDGRVRRLNLQHKNDWIGVERLEELQRCIDENQIDILLFHTGYARLSTFYEILLAKLMSIPVIMEVRSAFAALLIDQKSISDKFHVIYKMADRVVTLSETDSLFWRCLDCKSVYIPNPVEKIELKQHNPSIDKDSPIILWVGRIVQCPKQVLDVVGIMEYLIHKSQKAVLQIVGGKDNFVIYEELERLIEEKGMQDYIKICEYKSDINEMYDNASVVLMTSASESYSNVIVEAKMHSRPIVMYELPWLSTVQDGKGIISVKQRDLKGAADAVFELISNVDEWERYSREARESAEKMSEYDYMEDWRHLFSDIEAEAAYDYVVPKPEKNIVKILLDQLYDRGYPYKKVDEL